GRGLSAGPGVGGPFSGVPGAGAGNVTGAPAGAGGTAPSSSSTGGSTPGRPGAMPMGMMGAAGAGNDTRRRGHTPAGYLTNATNTTDIIGHPVKVTPPLLGNPPPSTESGVGAGPPETEEQTARHRIAALRAMSVPRRPASGPHE